MTGTVGVKTMMTKTDTQSRAEAEDRVSTNIALNPRHAHTVDAADAIDHTSQNTPQLRAVYSSIRLTKNRNYL